MKIDTVHNGCGMAIDVASMELVESYSDRTIKFSTSWKPILFRLLLKKRVMFSACS